MRIWLGRGTLPSGRRHHNIGIHIYEDEGVDITSVVAEIEALLHRQFPRVEITRSRRVRELLGKRPAQG